MRISDWSSDVCSSYLLVALFLAHDRHRLGHRPHCALCGGIGEIDRITKERARRRHVDDRAAVALVHQRNGVLAVEENALAHDRVDPAELLKAARKSGG